MKRLLLIALCCVSLYSCVKSLIDPDIQPLSGSSPQIMVHYMPWYASQPVSQDYRKKKADKTFPYRPEDLRLPIALYQLRQQAATDGQAAIRLDSAAALMFASENEAARKMLLRE